MVSLTWLESTLDKHGQLVTDKDLRRWLDRKYTNVRKGIGSLSGIPKRYDLRRS
jgi:hypothetical protein